MSYDLTLIQNGTGFNTYYNAVNTMTSNHLTHWVLVAVFVIVLTIALVRGYDNGVAFMGASLTNLFFVILLFTFGAVTQLILGISITIAIGAIIFKIFAE